MIDLNAYSDDQIVEIAQQRETAWRAALAEIDRRQLHRGRSLWSEQFTAACLERRRTDAGWHPNQQEQGCAETLPPPLFRMGYEWAALSLFAVLENIVGHPSDDIQDFTKFEPAGRTGLYRKVGEPRAYDGRRRAAFDLIDLLRGFVSTRLTGMLRPLPPLHSDYAPGKGSDPTRGER